jgi:protein gp37
MAEKTDIEWCDSTLNLEMGCDGCELWNPAAGVRHCYAGTLTERYAGAKGWPESFDKPKLFLQRLDKALKWSDLIGTNRPGKPWLNGHPRMIFLNDMGDTFTESLPIDWLAPLLPRIAASPHVYMVLTKRASRMRRFAKDHALPANVWPGVSLTTASTLPRLAELKLTRGGGPKWLSVEPMLEAIDFADAPLDPESTAGEWSLLDGIRLCIVGGESGPDARRFDVAWARSLRDQCKAAGVAFFLKQLGSNPEVMEAVTVPGCAPQEELLTLRLLDRKGGDPAEWPADLRDCRAFPRAE